VTLDEAAVPLNIKVYPCDFTVPEDGIIEGYSNLKNSSCTFCSAMCEPPKIDDSIDFFEGADITTIWTAVGIMAGVTLLWQIY